ncbi:MAG: aminotransferase class IV [Elusimicrobiota bacterium]
MKPLRVWFNGRIIPWDRPAVTVFDRGFLYGDGFYETLRVYNGRIFRFSEHFRRLQGSARGLRIRIPFSREKIRRGAESLLRANRLEEAVIRVTVTRGPAPLGFDPRPARRPSCALIAVPAPRHPEDGYRRGIRLALARVRRNPKISLDPALKSTNNLNNILAKMEAIRRGAYEALMLNVEGFLAEGTVSNIFWVRRGALETPSLDCGILEGVTRAEVLKIARAKGLGVREGRFRPARLYEADEAFITSTTMEIMPVSQVSDQTGRPRAVGNGRAGPWTQFLAGEYKKRAARETAGAPKRGRTS